MCPPSPVTINLRRTVRDPVSEIRRFDTDIGAFIESSVASSPKGLMALSIIYNNIVQGEVFLPGQIFVFGGFVPRAVNGPGVTKGLIWDERRHGPEVKTGWNYIGQPRWPNSDRR